MSIKVYICGTIIDPIENLINESNYKKIISSPNKSYSFTIKNLYDKKYEYNCIYLGSDDIGDKYQDYNRE